MDEFEHLHPINLEDSEEGQLAVDVYQKDNELVIVSPISGVTMNDIEILVHGDMLIIRGKRLPPENPKITDYLYRECYWGPFSKTIILPRDVDVENIRANLKDGILMIRIPKLREGSIKKIELQ
jgi:HSP20 family protein